MPLGAPPSAADGIAAGDIADCLLAPHAITSAQHAPARTPRVTTAILARRSPVAPHTARAGRRLRLVGATAAALLRLATRRLRARALLLRDVSSLPSSSAMPQIASALSQIASARLQTSLHVVGTRVPSGHTCCRVASRVLPRTTCSIARGADRGPCSASWRQSRIWVHSVGDLVALVAASPTSAWRTACTRRRRRSSPPSTSPSDDALHRSSISCFCSISLIWIDLSYALDRGALLLDRLRLVRVAVGVELRRARLVDLALARCRGSRRRSSRAGSGRCPRATVLIASSSWPWLTSSLASSARASLRTSSASGAPVGNSSDRIWRTEAIASTSLPSLM